MAADCCAQEDGKVCSKLAETLTGLQLDAMKVPRHQKMEKMKRNSKSKKNVWLIVAVAIGLVMVVGAQRVQADLEREEPSLPKDITIGSENDKLEEYSLSAHFDDQKQEIPNQSITTAIQEYDDIHTNSLCTGIASGGIRQILHDYPTEVIYLTKDREVWSCNKSTGQTSKKIQEEFSDSPYLKTIFGGKDKEEAEIFCAWTYFEMNQTEKMEFHFLRDRERNFRLYAEDNNQVVMPIINQSAFGVFTWDHIKENRYYDPVRTISFKNENIVSVSLLDGYVAAASRNSVKLPWLSPEVTVDLGLDNITAIQLLPNHQFLVAHGNQSQLNLYSQNCSLLHSITATGSARMPSTVTKIFYLHNAPNRPPVVLSQQSSGISSLVQVLENRLVVLEEKVYDREVNFVKGAAPDQFLVAGHDWIDSLTLEHRGNV